MSLEQLQPNSIWRFFEEICQVPRPSKKEGKIIKYLQEFAKKRQLECVKDDAGNILIRKPATADNGNLPWACLQSHMDMVCEKNSDVIHNFDVDPILPFIDGDWVRAKGTTLGADDGIGMAAQLALLDSADIQHGPVECLFTVDEETGLTGAFALKPGFLKSRVLLNLDSEDEGQICIGCAGGRDTQAFFHFNKVPLENSVSGIKITVSGLKGGHSGDDINKGRGNANQILTRILWNGERSFGLRLSHIDGGNLRNAIAREAYAIVTLPNRQKIAFIEFADELCRDIQKEYASNEPDLKIKLQLADLPKYLIDHVTQNRLLSALYTCPHGVMAMSHDIPGLVETSTNLASVKTEEARFVVSTSQRSSVESAKKDIVDRMDALFFALGAETIHNDGYPGWKPNVNSPILATALQSYKALFGKDAEYLAIHAGLECGLIGEKYPGMDMISFGPTLRGVHSPDERLEIASVPKFWDFLLEILKNVK